MPGAAADEAAQHKITKYATLVSTHTFLPFAIETGEYEIPWLSSSARLHCEAKKQRFIFAISLSNQAIF